MAEVIVRVLGPVGVDLREGASALLAAAQVYAPVGSIAIVVHFADKRESQLLADLIADTVQWRAALSGEPVA